MKEETTIIEGIKVNIIRKNIKNMYIRILPPHGEVKISAPLVMPDETVINFVRPPAFTVIVV